MFFITTMRHNPAYTGDDNSHERNVFDSRCFGYYETFEKAAEAVVGNFGDLQECYYDYALIEELGPGIHPLPDDLFNYPHETWFDWNREHERWEKCEKPLFSKNVCNWSIG